MQLTISKATKEDINTLLELIKGLASFEKRPQDVSATKESLTYWLFEKHIATALLIQYQDEIIGYAIYYPIFASFSAKGKVHLEDMYLKEDYRHKGLGKAFMKELVNHLIHEGYEGMAWSSLSWNTSSHAFYEALGATIEEGRTYFEFSDTSMNALLKN